LQSYQLPLVMLLHLQLMLLSLMLEIGKAGKRRGCRVLNGRPRFRLRLGKMREEIGWLLAKIQGLRWEAMIGSHGENPVRHTCFLWKRLV
jgi:hypothetical protein